MTDIFGNPLELGDFVVQAETKVDGTPIITMYEVVEPQDGALVGEVMSGDAIGCRFFLVETETRCIVLRNVYRDADYHKNVTVH